ncbi:sugar ABC transporter substrate-binding protein [Demequina soli]|uniref:sugar ABC transporter substrate-binding protein n=1 Tax=Demequina soli TaxID=1638987 RepID=UPI000783F385|nr:substrate-binding domain-containing protein [Demequina soli]
MKKSSLIAAGSLFAASVLVLAGCSSGGSSNGSSSGSSAAPSTSSTGAMAQGTACVILPDAASSPRWENGDRPALQKAITDAGFEANIQNAQGDTGKYATIADQMLTGGCGVMILVDYNGAATAVTAKAEAQGIPVIAYDRPIAKADYYVSFDNEKVGELEGQMIVDGLKAEGKDPATATVVYMGGDPADGNAAMFHDGAVKVMSAAGIKPAAEPPGVWDGQKSATNFEQALTKLGGKVDAVWVANDTNAAGVITVLDKNHLTVPVSGQDASVAGLQNVLLGKQTGTVYKPYQLEASETAKLAVELLKGETPTAPQTLDGVPFFPETPISIGNNDSIQQVFDDGNASYNEVCTGDVKAKCDAIGLKPAS